jgi:hypothetical protein
MKISHFGWVLALALVASPVLALAHVARTASQKLIAQGTHTLPEPPGDPGGGVAFQGTHTLPEPPSDPGGGAGA